ncbi:TonB family protein [Pseudoduganella sp. FT26W]|uniref:TonB family protein n=1 Tax=Duganella aquatilis TaxID=2666082 RepID=A0A844DDC6_9BURK|nr:TonB family protein [Duganella aquatilis]MRW87172.1 TonB family protein [Duganella aquatilis]
MKLYLAALAVAATQLAAPALAQTPASTKPAAQFSTCVKPEWPKESLRHEEQGTVQLAFLIGTDGSVRESRVERSTGHPLLDQAAQDSLARCKFKPGTENGQPVETWTRMQYVWKIDGPSQKQMEVDLAQARAGAERNEPEAAYKLGLIYLNGNGVPRDQDLARSWLEKAANQGSAGAQETLGLMASPRTGTAGDPALAAVWFRKAAEQGKANSQYFLAMLLHKQGNNDEAKMWLRKAAAQNHPTAQSALGSMLLASGQDDDLKEGIGFLQKAAAQQDRVAQVVLGQCYETGLGVSQDYAQAATLYQRAALAHNRMAELALARLYEQGLGVPQDKDKAQLLLQQTKAPQ